MKIIYYKNFKSIEIIGKNFVKLLDLKKNFKILKVFICILIYN